MSSSVKNIVMPAVVLLLVAAAEALVLGLVNLATANRIETIAEETMTTAKQSVLPADSYTEVDVETASDVDAVYAASTGGWVVQVTETGSQGTITIMVGIDSDLTCTGISITDSSETAGLGAVASQSSEKGEAFRDQFIGVSGTVSVSKDGGTIDALTGATITSRAVCRGVTAALECCASLG